MLVGVIIALLLAWWPANLNLPWTAFSEDSDMARKKNAAANFIVIRHFVGSFIRWFSRDQLSVPRRRRLCDYNVEHREQLLEDAAL